MGRVYLAEQRIGGVTRPVAIKTVVPGSADATVTARFLRECETVATLQSPNTVQVYDFGTVDNSLVLVMEFIDGHALSAELRRGPMALNLIDAVLVQIGGSLDEAHRRGVVHRDLKPDNILVTHRGGYDHFVKLVDFGIAQTTRATTSVSEKLTQSGVILGTPRYMAPEQFSADGVIDHRADIYSLGVITYEMLTGHTPFEARSPWEFGALHTSQEPPSLDGYESTAGLPAHRRAAVHRCLSKRPEDRPASVGLFLSEFLGVENPWAVLSGVSTGAQSEVSRREELPEVFAPTVRATVNPPESDKRFEAVAGSPSLRPSPWLWGALVFSIFIIASVFFVLGRRSHRGHKHDTVAAPDAVVSRLPDLRRWVSYLNAQRGVDAPKAALGQRDRAYARLSAGDWLAMEFSDGWWALTDGTTGRDLEVFIDPELPGPYRVEVGVDPQRMTVAGDDVRGSASFDLDAVGIREFRYVKISVQGRGELGLDAVYAPSGAARVDGGL